MFDIIVRLMDLALAAFQSRQTDTADNNYKELYLLYLAMNDVIAKSVTANEHYLPVSWNSPFLVNTTAFHTPVEKWVFFTNSDFAELSMSVKQFLARFRIYLQVISIRNPELDEMLTPCFRAKAIWVHKFIEILEVGSLTSDGKKLIAKSLTMGEPIEDRLYTHNIWQLGDAHIAVSEFDASSEDKR